MTPLISALVSRTGESEELEKSSAQDAYKAYMKQKKTVQEQYDLLRASFEGQLGKAEELCADADTLAADMKKQHDSGAVSQLDYDAVLVQVKDRYALLECIRLYIWLYTWLLAVTE